MSSGSILTIGFGSAWLGGTSLRAAPLVAPTDSPWWTYLFLMLLAVAMLALAGAVTIDPRSLVLRQALAGAALVWLVILGGAALYAVYAGRLGMETWQAVALIAADGFGLVALASTTTRDGQDETARHGPPGDRRDVRRGDPDGRRGRGHRDQPGPGSVAGDHQRGDPLDGLPWVPRSLILVLLPVAFGVASLASRLASGGTFYAQAAANRRTACCS